MTKVILSALLIAIFGCELSAAEPVAPKGWQANSNLDIDAAEAWLRRELTNDNGVMPQPTMNRLARTVALLQDGRLFVVYTRLYEMLDTGERAKLYKEQTLWIEKRLARAKEEASTERGGSLEDYMYWQSFLDDTKKRQKELQGRINILFKKAAKQPLPAAGISALRRMQSL